MDKVEVKIIWDEEKHFLSVGIGTNDASDTQEIRTAKGIAVALMWLKMEARSNKRAMLAALTELMNAILKDDDEQKQREIKIDREGFMRQLRELKEEAENE